MIRALRSVEWVALRGLWGRGDCTPSQPPSVRYGSGETICYRGRTIAGGLEGYIEDIIHNDTDGVGGKVTHTGNGKAVMGHLRGYEWLFPESGVMRDWNMGRAIGVNRHVGFYVGCVWQRIESDSQWVEGRGGGEGGITEHSMRWCTQMFVVNARVLRHVGVGELWWSEASHEDLVADRVEHEILGDNNEGHFSLFNVLWRLTLERVNFERMTFICTGENVLDTHVTTVDMRGSMTGGTHLLCTEHVCECEVMGGNNTRRTHVGHYSPWDTLGGGVMTIYCGGWFVCSSGDSIWLEGNYRRQCGYTQREGHICSLRWIWSGVGRKQYIRCLGWWAEYSIDDVSEWRYIATGSKLSTSEFWLSWTWDGHVILLTVRRLLMRSGEDVGVVYGVNLKFWCTHECGRLRTLDTSTCDYLNGLIRIEFLCCKGSELDYLGWMIGDILWGSSLIAISSSEQHTLWAVGIHLGIQRVWVRLWGVGVWRLEGRFPSLGTELGEEERCEEKWGGLETLSHNVIVASVIFRNYYTWRLTQDGYDEKTLGGVYSTICDNWIMTLCVGACTLSRSRGLQILSGVVLWIDRCTGNWSLNERFLPVYCIDTGWRRSSANLERRGKRSMQLPPTTDWVDSDEEDTGLNFSDIQKKLVVNSENRKTLLKTDHLIKTVTYTKEPSNKPKPINLRERRVQGIQDQSGQHHRAIQKKISRICKIDSGSLRNDRGRITGKGTIKTSCIDFEKVSYVEELKFNLLSVSQICDKKHNVLFTDKECLILSPKFKFVDEDLVILRAPRKNMYTVWI
ncbi:hypothetical protein Tco_1369914 [Tanacetum coccineum]